MLVFTYGTLKTEHRNHYFLEQFITKNVCKFLSKGTTVRKFPLTVDEKLYKVPCMLDNSDHLKAENVIGEVYEIDENHVKYLDDFEDYCPEKTSENWYTRMEIEVCLEKDDSKVSCSAYLISENREILKRLEQNDCWFNEYTKLVTEKYEYDWENDHAN